MVDSLHVLFENLKVLGQYACLSETELDEWAYLTKWAGMLPLDKIKKYDKFMSHEFNLFMFFKDKNFFDRVVKKHLSNKV
jgi:hypothetical protein